MSVEKRPNQLAADIFQSEFEMGVLVYGVVTAVKRAGTNIEALLIGDLFRAD